MPSAAWPFLGVDPSEKCLYYWLVCLDRFILNGSVGDRVLGGNLGSLHSVLQGPTIPLAWLHGLKLPLAFPFLPLSDSELEGGSPLPPLLSSLLLG